MTSTNLQPERHNAVPITGEDVVINGSGFGKILFEDGAVTFYRKSKRWVKFQAYLKGTLFTPTARAIDANTITYQGGKYFQAHYEFWDDSYKETITLKDAPQAQRFDLSDMSFLITTSEGTHVSQQANGDLWLMRTASGGITERCLMVIPSPTAVDANSVAYPVAWSYNESTHFLTITGSLTGATYPVTIDPGVQLDTSVDANATDEPGRHICRDTAGRIWTAHFDDQDIEVNYSDDNGATFTTEEPWTSKYTNYGLSIAVDGNRNVHVAWLDYNARALYLKRTHSSSTWDSSPTVLISFYYIGAGNSTDTLVDSSNNIYVVACGDNTDDKLSIIKYSGGSWGSVSASTLHINTFAAAISSDGHVHVTYIDESSSPNPVKYVEYTTSWGTPETVDAPSTYNDSSPSVVIDSNGSDVHTSYHRNGGVYYRKKTGDSWGNEETGTSSDVLTGENTLILDQADNPIIYYTTSSNGYFARVMKTGSGWVAETLSTWSGSFLNISAAWSYYPRCTSNTTSNVFIGGAITVCTQYVSSKYYAQFLQSNDFQPANTCETVYSCQLGSDVNSYVSCGGAGRKGGRDSDGRLWVVFHEYIGTTAYVTAKYSDDEGKSWTKETVASDASNGDNSCREPSLVIDSDKNVHVAYKVVSGSYTEIRYKKRTDSTSTWETVEDVTSSSSSNQTLPVIDLDSSGYPHIVWMSGAYILKYRYKTSGGWQSVETARDNGANDIYSFDMVIDSSNYVHVSYIDTVAIPRYVHHTRRTTSWQTPVDIISTGGNTYDHNLVVGADGYLYCIVYDSNQASIEKFTTSWAHITSTIIYSSALFISGTIDNDGTIYVLYSGTSGNDLYYKKYDGSWSGATTVFVGIYPGTNILFVSPLIKNTQYGMPETGAAFVFCGLCLNNTSYNDVYIWKSSDLTWSAGGPTTVKIEESLKYTVQRTLTPITKTLDYKIKRVSLVTKDVAYKIKRSTSITKDLKYVIYRTVVPVTKNVQYYIRLTKPVITKDLQYVTSKATILQKSILYTISRTVTSITKSLTYSIRSTPIAITKTVLYNISRTIPVVTKSLTYSIESPKLVSKDISYYVIKSRSVDKSVSYAVGTTSGISKSLSYSILRVLSKSLTYTVESVRLISKDLEYVISTSQVKQIDKDLKYAIKATLVPIVKDISYAIVRQYIPTKSLVYTISATQLIQKSLQYCIKSGISVVKDIRYYIVGSTIVDKDLTYSVAIPKLLNKTITYYITKSLPLFKSVSYVVKTSVSIQKTIVYTVVQSTSLIQSLSYTVRSSVPLAVSLVYAVRSTESLQKTIIYAIHRTVPEITKNLVYSVAQITGISKQLQYSIVRNAQVAKILAYSVQTSSSIQKTIIYTVQYSTSITRQLVYNVLYSCTVQKDIQYVIIPSAPILAQEGSCIRISWVVT